MRKNLLNTLIGIVLIVVGVVLSIDFILSFAKAAIGILLLIIGMSFLTRRF